MQLSEVREVDLLRVIQRARANLAFMKDSGHTGLTPNIFRTQIAVPVPFLKPWNPDVMAATLVEAALSEVEREAEHRYSLIWNDRKDKSSRILGLGIGLWFIGPRGERSDYYDQLVRAMENEDARAIRSITATMIVLKAAGRDEGTNISEIAAKWGYVFEEADGD